MKNIFDSLRAKWRSCAKNEIKPLLDKSEQSIGNIQAKYPHIIKFTSFFVRLIIIVNGLA